MSVEDLVKLAEEIKNNLKLLLEGELSVGFVSITEGIVYLDAPLKKYQEYINNFSSENFKLLNIYDHSLPLSGIRLGFFKTSESSITILAASGDGPVGQLLVFKSRIDLFSERIEEIISKVRVTAPLIIEEEKEEGPPSEFDNIIPHIKDKYKKKKYTMEEAVVIHQIDGEKSIAKISKIAELDVLKVEEIIEKYEKKKYIQLERVTAVSEVPQKKKESEALKLLEELEQEVKVPEQIPFLDNKEELEPVESQALPSSDGAELEESEPEPIPIKKEIISSDIHETFDIFPIFDKTKHKFSRDEGYYLQFCDGRHSINDIIELTNVDKRVLFKIFRKFQKKDGLKLIRFIGKVEIEPVEPLKKPTSKKVDEQPMPPKEVEAVSSEDEVLDILKTLDNELSDLDVGGDELDRDIESISLPAPESEEIKVPAKSIPEPIKEIEADIELSILEEPLTLENKVEDTLEELSSLVDIPEVEEESKPIVFEEALSELDKLIDEATEVVSEINAVQESVSESIEENGEEGAQQEQISTHPIPSETPEPDLIPVKIKNQVTCEMCGAEFPASKRLCPSCHKPAKICPNCGQPVTVFAKICPYCTGLIN